MWQVTYAFLQAIMDAITGVALPSGLTGPLESVYYGLYTAVSGPISPGTLQSALTEPGYNGYARQLVTWYHTYLGQQGPQVLSGASLEFTPTDSANSVNIQGIFVSSALTGGVLLMAMSLPSPGVVLGSPQTAMLVQPQFQLTYAPQYGQASYQS
jgi:hypothetical protein